MLHVTCHPSQTWDMSYCLPVFRGVKQLLLCCCHYVSIIYSLKLYCFRLVPLIYDVMMWALNMQDWLYFFWAYWASWVWAGHEDTDTWHEDTNLCRTCDILTRSLVLRVAIGHLRVTIGYFSISKYKANTTCNWASPQSKANLLPFVFFISLRKILRLSPSKPSNFMSNFKQMFL